MKKSIFAVLICTFLFLAACSAQKIEDVQNATDDATDNTSVVEESVSVEEDATTRLVEHAFGTTEIPSNPERIVSVYLEDMLLALEVPLELAVTVGEDNYLSEEIHSRGIETVAAGENVDFELILEHQPDLIITMDVISQEVYDALNKIAPTIAFSRRAWQDSLPKLGAALGMEEKAQKIIDDYAVHVTEANEALADVLKDEPTAAAIRFTAKTMRLYFPRVRGAATRQGYVTSLYEDIGFGVEDYISQLQQAEDPARENAQISMEVLPELQSDYVFVIIGSAGNTSDAQSQDLTDFEEISSSDIWAGLTAVQEDHVYYLESRYWISDGPLADTMKINQVVELLTN